MSNETKPQNGQQLCIHYGKALQLTADEYLAIYMLMETDLEKPFSCHGRNRE